jgi:hypothetical protein
MTIWSTLLGLTSTTMFVLGHLVLRMCGEPSLPIQGSFLECLGSYLVTPILLCSISRWSMLAWSIWILDVARESIGQFFRNSEPCWRTSLITSQLNDGYLYPESWDEEVSRKAKRSCVAISASMDGIHPRLWRQATSAPNAMLQSALLKSALLICVPTGMRTSWRWLKREDSQNQPNES